MALYAFDGTLDDSRETPTDAEGIGNMSNVWKFYQMYDGYTKPQGIANVYEPGVGTKFGAVGAALGGAFGVGWLDRVNSAYDTMCAAWLNGDHIIDVVGFSRGAATALDFVNKIAQDGITQGDRVVGVTPQIRFLGLFDVVAAFGVANLGFSFAKLNVGHDLDLPEHVQHCFHAMSLDERRPSFTVTRVSGGYETWFRGVHSDIGGGNDNVGLSNITLRWMLRKAILAGLPVTEANITDSACKPESRINPNVFSDLSKLTWRDVNAADLLHYTVPMHVVLPDEPCRDVPASMPIETQAFEQQRISLAPITT